MLRAIAVAKKKNDRIDAKKIADCLRCDFLPECYMASTEIRERRRTLRYRNLLVRQAIQKPVVHGEHGQRVLKELVRSYLTISNFRVARHWLIITWVSGVLLAHR